MSNGSRVRAQRDYGKTSVEFSRCGLLSGRSRNDRGVQLTFAAGAGRCDYEPRRLKRRTSGGLDFEVRDS